MGYENRSMPRLCCRAVMGFAAAVAACAACGQTIYKWVDSTGVTQYSATPPPKGTAATMIHTTPPPPAEVAEQAKTDAKRRLDDAERRAAERSREQAQQQAQDEAGRRNAAARVQRCASAREQLSAVSRGGPVFRYNERNERVYLEDSARDAEIARLRAEVSTACSSSDSAQGAQDLATRQRIAEAGRSAQCNAARDTLRDLEAGGSHIPGWEIEKARDKAAQLCGSAANSR